MKDNTRIGWPALAAVLCSVIFPWAAWAQEAKTSFKFDFGSGKVQAGYSQVLPDSVYSDETGFGFDFGSKPTATDRGGSDDLRGDFVTSEQPFFFSVKVPEGNYRITVILGDSQGESATTIRAESGRMMVPGVKTASGKFETRTFVTNMHTPHLPPPPQNAPGGAEVRMTAIPGEASAWHWDDRLTIEFNNSRPCVCAMEIERVDNLPTIFVGGDSTVADPRSGPGGNWPTMLTQWLKPEIVVANNAQSGETLKSYITGLRMDKVLSQIKPGDYFFIQFGHNDQKQSWPQTYAEPGTTYNAYLRAFIAETRRRGATLVLVTPMERQQNGDSVGPWARAMREVAAQENVPLIDQWDMSKQLWTAMGANTRLAFNDQTHPSGYGGYLLSKIIVMEIKKNVPELAKYIVDDFKDLDLKNVDPPPEYLSQPSGVGGGRGGRGGRGNRGN